MKLTTLVMRLKENRDKKRLSQGQVAEYCEVKSAAVISAWENDINKPDIDCILKLCDLYGVSPTYLLGYDKEEIILVSDEEYNVVKRMRNLDDRGYDGLIDYLDFQERYINNYSLSNHIREEKTTITVSSSNKKNDLGHALNYRDPDYNTMKQKCRELKKLKKRSYRSIEDVTKFLWDYGYGDDVNMLLVIDIFAGRKVPNELMYTHIYAYLTHQISYSIDGVEF